MSTKSHKQLNQSLSTTTANNAGMSNKTKFKSTAAVSGKKIARDLREEFDQFQLREDPGQQAPQSSVGDAEFVEEVDEQQQQTNNKPLRNSRKANKKNEKHETTGLKPQPHKPHAQPSPLPPTSQIPKSYITAMQHLQDLIEIKNEQINKLKNQLIDKQQIILDSQSRINQILIKYHQLMDMYSRKQNQITFLKDQIDQLKIDKQVTLKHAAKMLGNQFKVQMYREGREIKEFGYREEVIQNQVPIVRKRAMSSNGFGNAHRQVWTAGANKRFENPTPTPVVRTIIDSQPLLTHHQPLQTKISTQQIRLPQSHRPSPLMQLSQTPLLLKSSLNLNSTNNLGQINSTNRDFISYQREVLRNQKQLIALKYRMECLERKLVTNPKEDGVKTKIRRLSQEIQTKERMISNLKNM